MAVKLMILLSFIHDRTSARAPPKLPLPHTKHVKKKRKKKKNESQRGDCFPPTLTGCERLPPRPLARSLAAPVPRRLSLFRYGAALRVNAVFIPQRLLLHFTAKGTGVCAGGGCARLGKWPARAPLRTSPSGVDGDFAGRRVSLCSLLGGGSEM